MKSMLSSYFCFLKMIIWYITWPFHQIYSGIFQLTKYYFKILTLLGRLTKRSATLFIDESVFVSFTQWIHQPIVVFPDEDSSILYCTWWFYHQSHLNLVATPKLRMYLVIDII